MSKIVIYTAITKENYDILKVPTVSQNVDMICFSNSNCEVGNWHIKKLPVLQYDSIRLARYIKHNPHVLLPEYKWSIWVDASLLITGKLIEIIDYLEIKNSMFGVYKHPVRNCIYQAANKCVLKKKDSEEIIKRQVHRYKMDGYLEDKGLVASGVLARKHNDFKIVEFQRIWWNEIQKFSRRDQLSFNYLAWKKNFEYSLIKGNIGDGSYFLRNQHNINHYT